MKYAMISLGAIAAGIFIYSIYAFMLKPGQFKTIAFLFMFVAAAFFVLVIIKKIREERKVKEKMNPVKKDKKI